MEKHYQILYEFRWEEFRKTFRIILDDKTLAILYPKPNKGPDWTRLGYNKCECCTLTEIQFPYCPIALNIFEIVEEFKDTTSHEKCFVRCFTPERMYAKKTTVMDGLSSIFSLIMATSDCPIMEMFRPMARFHLPFSTIKETVIRSTSMFLLRQYLIHKDNKAFIFDFSDLDRHYAKVQLLNEGIFSRIKDVVARDADKNAIISLHTLSNLLCIELELDMESIRDLFVIKRNERNDE